jgi:flagellar hook assembly protein FlgD
MQREATLTYEVAEKTDVTVALYNAIGRRVRTFVDATKAPGRYRITWRGTGGGGQPVASGVYFLRMTAGTTQATERIVVVR